MAAILGFLLQHLQEGGQGIAVAGLGETRHRLGAHGGQLELVAELADALPHDAGVGVHHPHTPDRGQAAGEQVVVDLQVRLAGQHQRRRLGRLGLGQVFHLGVVEGLARLQQQGQRAVHIGHGGRRHGLRRQVQDPHVLHVGTFPAPFPERVVGETELHGGKQLLSEAVAGEGSRACAPGN